MFHFNMLSTSKLKTEIASMVVRVSQYDNNNITLLEEPEGGSEASLVS